MIRPEFSKSDAEVSASLATNGINQRPTSHEPRLMSGLTQEDREALVGLRRWHVVSDLRDTETVVEQIITRHVREALEAAAVAVEEQRDSEHTGFGSVPFGGGEPSWLGDRPYNEAARIIRAHQP